MRPCHGRDRGFESRRLRHLSFRHGAIAQLGERVNRTHEVRGSNPLSSTRVRPSKTAAGWHAPVAQLDRVPDYESGGRRFESCPARQHGEVSEWSKVQHWKCCVRDNRTVGSNPTLSARPGPGIPGLGVQIGLWRSLVARLLGVKRSQVQILSARPFGWQMCASTSAIQMGSPAACARWSPVTAVVAVWAAWKAPGNKCTTAHDVSPPGAEVSLPTAHRLSRGVAQLGRAHGSGP